MTDKQAYELMVKFSGGETQIAKIMQMVHAVGVEETTKAMLSGYQSEGKEVPKAFNDFMRQAFKYIQTNNQS